VPTVNQSSVRQTNRVLRVGEHKKVGA
jgi:hypothetical protein